MRDMDQLLKDLFQRMLMDGPPTIKLADCANIIDDLELEEVNELSNRLIDLYDRTEKSDINVDIETAPIVNILNVLHWTDSVSSVKSNKDVGTARKILQQLESDQMKSHKGGI